MRLPYIPRILGRLDERYFCGRSHGPRRREHPQQRSATPVQEDYFGRATQKCRSYLSVDENHWLLGLVTRAEISQCHKKAPNSTLAEYAKDQNIAVATSQETVKGRWAS